MILNFQQNQQSNFQQSQFQFSTMPNCQSGVIPQINNCSSCQIKEFAKNEIITTYIVNRNMLCIVLEGSADLIRYDFNGNQMVVERFNK